MFCGTGSPIASGASFDALGKSKSFGLLSYPNAGLSSARLLGSIAAEGSPRIGRTAIEKRLRFCTSPQFGSCSENSVIRPKVSGQTLSAPRRQPVNFASHPGDSDPWTCAAAELRGVAAAQNSD